MSKTANLALFVLVLVSSTLVHAQGTSGSISGTVSDPQGAVVTGAHVTVQGQGLHPRQLATDAYGRYRALLLPPGRYQVRVEHVDFKPAERNDLVLSVAEDAVINFRLQLRSLATGVVVHGELPQVDTASSTLSGLVPERAIRDLPLNGRDLSQLILLQPGLVWSRASVDSAPNGRGTHLAVAGSRPYQNLFVVDGIIVNDALNNTPGSAQGLLLGVETIQEFRVLTNTYSAEYGRASGGVFVGVSKSGTDQLHGSAFEFLRNDQLDARNYFDQQRPEFRRNQFGFSLGGPVIRNKTFFFGSYEGLREFKGITQVAAVPNEQARAGRLPGQKPQTVDPRSQPILDLYPAANGPSLGGGVAQFIGTIDRLSTNDFFTVRVDHTLSAADSLFVKYSFEDSDQVLPQSFPEFPNLATNRKQVVSIEERKVISQSLVNQLRFGFSRTSPTELAAPTSRSLQLVKGQPLGLIQVSGLSDVGADYTVPKIFVQNDFQVAELLSLVRGRHYMKMGGLVERFQDNGRAESRTRGQLRFATLADLLAFKVQDLQAATPGTDPVRNYRQWLVGVFFQDDIKLSSRLTINAGLRYEKVTAPFDVHGKVSSLRNVLDPAVTVGGTLFLPPSHNFAPRIGFAFDPAGSGKTVIRAGFGMFYDEPLFSMFRPAAFFAAPFANRARLRGALVTALPVDPTALLGVERSTDSIDYRLRPSYAMQYNLNVQREMLTGTVFTLGYVGSRGVNVIGVGDVNTAIPQILADGRQFWPEGSKRRNPNFDAIRRTTQGFDSHYDSLIVSALRRFRRGLQFQVSYTLGHSRDDISGFGSLNWANGQSGFFDPYVRALDRGPSNFDIRHTWVAYASYELPFRSKGWAQHLVGGWQLNTIVTLSSGVPFTPIISGDPDRDGSDVNGPRPDRVPGVSLEPAGGSTPQLWFNPAAFAAPAPGFRGTAGRNILLGPKYRSAEISAMKNIPLGERMRLQLRVESFNLLNRANFALPANSRNGEQIFTYVPASGKTAAQFLPTPGVGQVFDTIGDARQIQLGLKWLF